MPVITLEDFDSGLWLIGDPTSIPENAMVNAIGMNPVHSKSVRQRYGNTQLFANTAISLFYFGGNLYSLDASGNFAKNGVNIKTGLTVGARASIVKAPPHFGSTAYMFVAGAGSQFKVDESGGVTQWGIAAPADGITAVANSNPINVTIEGFQANSGFTALAGTVLSLDNSDFIFGTGSIQAVISNKNHGGLSKSVTINLNPAGSSDSDFIQMYVQIDDPTKLKNIVLQFDLNSLNYTTDYFTTTIPVSAITLQPATPPTDPNTAAGLDLASNAVLGQAFTNPPPLAAAQITQEFIAAQKNYLVKKFGTDTSATFFKPSSGAVAKILGSTGNVTTPSDDNWFLVQVPRSNFTRFGTNNSLGWQSVTGFRIRIHNLHSSDKSTLHFDQLALVGGVGIIGTVQYAFTYANPTTGSYSQPNPTPLVVKNVNRTGITLSNFTASADAQATTLIIWRSMGNGGIFYKLATLTAPYPTSFVDDNADFIGFGPNPTSLANWVTGTGYTTGNLILPLTNNAGGFVFVATTNGTSGGPNPTFPQTVGATVIDNTETWQNIGSTLSLGIEPLVQVNILPFPVTQIAFWKGTMFGCGDPTAGQKGRIYYSSPGFAEGVAGFTDITNDDDPTTGFGIFNDNLYVFTTRGLYQVVDISINVSLPGFAVIKQQGAPGCTAPFSIVSTPNALIYQGPDGLYLFDGYFAERAVPQMLTLFRGETVQLLPSISTIIAATYGRDEYWFSDGNNAVYALNVMPSSIAGQRATPITVRCHSANSASALFYENSNNIMYAGWLNGASNHIFSLEAPGKFASDDVNGTVPFTFKPRAFYSGLKYTHKIQRVFFDMNPAGNTIAASIIVDGSANLALGNITGSSRATTVFTYNTSGRVVQLLLVNSGGGSSAVIELFKCGIETEDSGLQDAAGKGS